MSATNINDYTILWSGENVEKCRELNVYRLCECGCSDKEGAVGYLSGSDEDGNGFTLYLFNENLYQLLEELIRQHHVDAVHDYMDGIGEMYADC